MSEQDELRVRAEARRAPAHPDITEAMIRDLVHAFYAEVRRDEVLGPIFERALPDDWGPHLDRMCDFWSSVLLVTGRYKGRPVPAHARLPGIAPEHFAHWLALFERTARRLCRADIADVFVDRAHMIGKSLQLSLFFADRIAPADAFERGVLR